MKASDGTASGGTASGGTASGGTPTADAGQTPGEPLEPDQVASEPPAGPARAESSIPAGTAGTAVAADAAGAAGADLDRRRFFRQFATDVFQTAATVVGAASVLQRSSAEAASAILGGPREPDALMAATTPGGAFATAAGPTSLAGSAAGSPGIGVSGAIGTAAAAIPAVGYRAAFRIDGDRIILVDQRRLPFVLADVECRTAIDVAHAIGERSVVGGPAIAQVAALGLALSANRVRASRPYARRAILRAAETTLIGACPTSRAAAAAVERVMARYVAIGELDEDGDRVADAMLDEANAIVFEANDDHGRIADAAVARIPRRADRPAGILTLGSTGAMAGGQFGTALGAIQAATYAGVEVRVHVAESRPYLDGARIAAWELAQAGVRHVILADAAIGSLLQRGGIDIVLVGAHAIARNGDVANDVGTYPLAALASRHGVPVIVCATLATVDPNADDGRALPTADGQAVDVLQVLTSPVVPRDTPAISPLVDVTPAGLVTAYATEEGLIEGSFAAGYAAALQRRAERLPRVAADATPVPAPTTVVH